MCYYDQHLFSCGDWKWGHFRSHCQKEYRIGETCGLRLVYNAHAVGTKCKICEKIDTKYRRRAAESDRVKRWQREPGRYRASIEKSLDTIHDLDREIYELQHDRARRQQAIGSRR